MRAVRVLIAVAVAALTASACGSEAAQLPSSTPPPPPPATSTSSPAPTTTSSAPTSSAVVSTPPPISAPPAGPVDPLTGGPLSANPVVAVKIDNTYFDVPQFGVADADLVYVQQVEGGLTRLIAVFHTNLDVEVGPVRSVRSTDAELLPAFGVPALVFSGGAQGPLDLLAATPVVNASGAAGLFRSDAASGSYNLHANLDEVVDGISDLGPVQTIGMNFSGTDPRVAAGTPVTDLAVQMQAGRTAFQFADGVWQRMRNGEPVIDFQGGAQVADNVVVQWVDVEPDGTYDSVGSPSLLSHTVGNGEMTLYRDGHALEGSWSRDSSDGPFSYLDAAGKPLPFKPGRTWVLLAPSSAQVETS